MMKANWRDMYDDNRVSVLKQYRDIELNTLCKFIKKIHLSDKINTVIFLPFKDIWCDSVKSINWESHVEYYIIFENTSIYPVSTKYLNKIQQKYNVHYILFMVDPWKHRYSRKARYYSQNIKFDYIFTFDPADAKEYGFIYYMVPYSMLSDNKVRGGIINDLFFCGTANDRLEKLLKIYESGRINQTNILYMINGVETLAQKHDDTIVYNKRISYNEVVERDNGSNCILEVISTMQSGATLRYYEAVCYNKKLLTNNKNVVNLPFYNPDYVHVFEKPEDIDWNWVKERIPVDYHYDGRFSPTHLIDKIIELEEEKERKELGKEETD